MPVCLDADRISPDLAEHAIGSDFREPASRHLHIGLINNMPDRAMQATERQFVKLLGAASPGIAVHLSLYALPDVPRTEWGRSRVNHYYSSVESLWDNSLDGLIVTGADSAAPLLTDESYWGSLTRVLEWAEHHTLSTVWSCLAAHAAVLHLDGIPIRRLREKCFGVLNCTQASDHRLTANSPSDLQVPHSRWNDLGESDLTDCGYRMLTRTQDGGVDAFVKQRKSLFVFMQGHPEYEANTLLLEYRRDIGQYLRRESEVYPQLPRGYFEQNVVDALSVLRDRAMADRSEELLADFPLGLLENRVKNNWLSTGARLYGNWLRGLGAQKQKRARQANSATRPAEAKLKKPVARRRVQL
jgi:homoserine O-succinyltransferase